MWEGQGGCGGLFLGAFLRFQTALWFSELLLHCLSQPRSEQGIEEEESFDRGEAMMGLVTNVEPKPPSSQASRPHKRYSVEPSCRLCICSQAQLNTVAQAALVFTATHEDPGCITEFWARVVL